VRVVNIRERG